MVLHELKLAKVVSSEDAFHELISEQRGILDQHSGRDQDVADDIFIYDPIEIDCTKTLFVCGGMGPMAGLLAWETAVTRFPRRRVVLDQRCSIPDRTAAILHGIESTEAKQVAHKLSEAFALASEFGSLEEPVDVFISCNTAHAFIPGALRLLPGHLEQKLSIHSMVAIAAEGCTQEEGKTVVLSTTGTRKSNLYKNILESRKVDMFEISEESQASLMAAIYDGIKNGSDHQAIKHGYDALKSLEQKDGLSTIIAACTEIPILLDLLQDSNILSLGKFRVIDPVVEVLDHIRMVQGPPSPTWRRSYHASRGMLNLAA